MKFFYPSPRLKDQKLFLILIKFKICQILNTYIITRLTLAKEVLVLDLVFMDGLSH